MDLHRTKLGRPLAAIAAIGAILCALAFALPSGATVAPSGAGAPAGASVSSARALELPILATLNGVRRAYGLRPLARSAQLTRAASGHARALALAGEFRHEWPGGQRFDLWIRRFYPVGASRSWAVGENLIWSTADLTPGQVASAWLASPTHRRVLLTPSWRSLGIGVVRATAAPGVYGGTDVMIAAADFGARR